MADKREELETLARDLVQRSGLRDLSFRQLADKTGVKSSSVHYYFPEKHDLTAALIKRYSDAFIDALRFIDTSESTLRRKLTAFVDLFEAAAADDKLCLCGMLAAEVATLDAASRKLLEAFFQQSESWLASVFKHHKNELTSPMQAEQLAAVLMSGLEGALLLDRVHGKHTHLRAQRQLIASFVVRGSR